MVRFTVASVFDIAVIVKQLHSENTPYEKIGDEVRSLVDLAPFEIPSSWEWCRVGDLFSNMSGLAYKKGALAIKTDKMIRVLRAEISVRSSFFLRATMFYLKRTCKNRTVFEEKLYDYPCC